MDRKVIIAVVASLLLVSCYDSFDTLVVDGSSSSVAEANTTISHLHTLYASGTRVINEDIVVEGVVTANDEFGNFFKSFVIEEDGYALEILDGLYDSYVCHGVGSTIAIKLNGLGLDRYLGVLRCGLVAPLTSYYTLDYMTSTAIVDYYIDLVDMGNPVTPNATTISELQEDQAGRLIALESLTLLTEDGVERTWSGYSLFRNSALDSIWCYTSPYADFASSTIPSCELSLSGILEFGSTDSATDQFIIKLHGSEGCTY